MIYSDKYQNVDILTKSFNKKNTKSFTLSLFFLPYPPINLVNNHQRPFPSRNILTYIFSHQSLQLIICHITLNKVILLYLLYLFTNLLLLKSLLRFFVRDELVLF